MLKQLPNLARLHIHCYVSVVGHIGKSDPMRPFTIRNSMTTRRNGPYAPVWMDGVLGAAELKEIFPKMRGIGIKASEKLTILAIREFIIGEPMPHGDKDWPEVILIQNE